jgi:hypothetical protein
MRHGVRQMIMGAIVLCGIGLVALGMIDGRQLLVIGATPPEALGAQVAWTVVPLAVGLWLVVWGLTAGRGWVRGRRQPPTGGTS